MIIYFTNRAFDIIGQASTNLPKGLIISDDEKTEDTSSGVASFSFQIAYEKAERISVKSMTAVGNYVLRTNGEENEAYTIIDVTESTDGQTLEIYAEDAGLDLLNSIAGKYEATTAHSAEWYILKFTAGSGFEIGVNEVQGLSKTLKWESATTVTARVASIATQFYGCEISYSFEVKGLKISHKYINIYRQRGQDISAQLRLNEEVNLIETKTSIGNLATALIAVGGIPENEEEAINLIGYDYDDGDFYVNSAGWICSRNALKIWGRAPECSTHVTKEYTVTTTDKATLFSESLAALKKACIAEINYEIEILEMPENIKIGDRVNIIDEGGELYLSSRILKLTQSIAKNKYSATLGEYLIKSGGISDRVLALSTEFATIAKARSYFTWTAYADDENGLNISADPEGHSYMGIATNQLKSEPDFTDAIVYKWAKIIGPTGDKGNAGTGVDLVTRYYQLTDGTVPSKPTTNPPDTGWIETEPTYTEGSTQKLYIIDITEFDNGLWKCSAVSCSSSYEVAKAAYVKATTAQTTADNNVTELNNSVDTLHDEIQTTTDAALTETINTIEDNYYNKTDADGQVSQLQTQIIENADKIELRFNENQKNLNTAAGNSEEKFTEIQKYIRFEDGNIILGEAGNEMKLQIENDKISFLQGINEVAYWTNNKLYVKDGEFLNSLKLGKFAFTPRINGNLSFRKVVE